LTISVSPGNNRSVGGTIDPLYLNSGFPVTGSAWALTLNVRLPLLLTTCGGFPDAGSEVGTLPMVATVKPEI
jgi:hypothetical protein